MKKKFFKFLLTAATAVAAAVAALGAAACNVSPKLLEENIIEDKYDNYYEIFVYSFCDSDGDGYGDLNGITQKLDYIRDMGYTGIWLMPVHESSSYHGYDVTDYKSINSKYGTVEDYENLISAAHEKGIKVIIDLVVNHTSSNHTWFKEALAFKQGRGGQAKYADYYTWSDLSLEGYHGSGNLFYESWFDGGMPDLNLDNTAVRSEIESIIEYWLEKGTDGFRLDGCKYYYYGQTQKSVDFCGWIQQTAEKYNEDVYIVGEMWAGRGEIQNFYESGADSFFYFPAAGDVSSSVNMNSADNLWSSIRNVTRTAGDYIAAPFLSNHDNGVGRIAGRMAREEENIKFAYGLLSLYPGNTFTYYGDEIGMVAKNPNKDPDLRISMLWDKDKTALTKVPPGASKEQEYLFGSVEEQQKNGNSILNYYRQCNNLRNAFPELMRGQSSRIATEEFEVLAFRRTYGERSVTVVVNLAEENKTVSGIEGTLVQSICVTGSVGQSGGSLKMPRRSIAILT